MMRINRWIGMVLFSMSFCAAAQASVSWSEWRGDLRKEALKQGISPEVFDVAFKGVQPSKRVVELDRNQPEDRLTFKKYRATRIDAYRIRLGVKKYKKHRDQLEKIGKEYGVDPYIIAALWGIESSYGHFKGKFPVIASLATLAYDGRRSDFFRNELLMALHILNGDHISLKDFKGEWAGASGHSQFLPSSWHKYAVDQNRDGRKDIWNNLEDVFASIANYLVGHGWVSGQTWGLEVRLPKDFDESLLNSQKLRPMSEWVGMGVMPIKGANFPQGNPDGNIIQLYGGSTFLVFNNYYVLKAYNASGFYAASVGYLAQSIEAKVSAKHKQKGS